MDLHGKLQSHPIPTVIHIRLHRRPMQNEMTMAASFTWYGVVSAVNGCRRVACSASQCQSQSHDSMWRSVRRVVKSIGGSIRGISPDDSLKEGHWVKLICGASFEDVADVRNLSLVYALAGVDCIDCAAEASVVTAVKEGIDMAKQISISSEIYQSPSLRKPWIMISVNDDKDLHFRKAYFNPEDCPLDCSRPCEKVCPANAIKLQNATLHTNTIQDDASLDKFQGGVISERCYGCGRCLPVCPYDMIRANTYVRSSVAVTELLQRVDIDAIEIHTSARCIDSFKNLWDNLSKEMEHLKLIAVSLPDLGELTIDALDSMYSIMKPSLRSYNLWQLDGRPMSGDIGKGATRESIAFASRMALDRNCPPGFLQLAGGTNAHTIDALKRIGLFRSSSIPEHATECKNPRRPLLARNQINSKTLIAGVAYGGYARKIVGRVLRKISYFHDRYSTSIHIEEYPHFLLEALEEAISLIGPIKGYNLQKNS